MSDFYADVPGHRMALDRDGTNMYVISSTNVVTQLTGPQVVDVSNEVNGGVFVCGQNENGSLLVIFPELRDIVGYYLNVAGGNTDLVLLDSSPDSTNGVDGTWTPLSPSVGYNENIQPGYRTHISALSLTGIRCMRFHYHASAPTYGASLGVHIYGGASAGQNPDRLILWHPTTDTQLSGSWFDFEDTPRLSGADKTFRVKNNSATLTATASVLAVDALTDTTPSVPAQFTLSQNGTSFASTQTIGDLAPGAISPVQTVRRTTPADAVLSLWAARIAVVAATWV